MRRWRGVARHVVDLAHGEERRRDPTKQGLPPEYQGLLEQGPPSLPRPTRARRRLASQRRGSMSSSIPRRVRGGVRIWQLTPTTAPAASSRHGSGRSLGMHVSTSRDRSRCGPCLDAGCLACCKRGSSYIRMRQAAGPLRSAEVGRASTLSDREARVAATAPMSAHVLAFVTVACSCMYVSLGSLSSATA